MIGTRLADRYEITSELGRGGMGIVYRAHDPLLGREVAVKLIPPALLSADTEERFRREAQLVAQMDHPGIVPIYDLGGHEGSLFFVMPVVQGTTLRSFLKEGSLPLGDIVDTALQTCEALEYSHARGVIHRDIKPENIMLARDETGAIRVRVMDFGLARASSENRLTKTGTIVGTLSYLSPEQVSAKNVDSRSDIYAFGTVLYESVVGEPPFSGEVQSILYRIVHEIPRPPRSLNASIGEELERIILACLAKDPARRPQRAGEVAELLRRYRAGLREEERSRSVLLTRAIQSQRPALSPFVGRGDEIAELQQRLNAAVDGECQFVAIGGEPGTGKTRLIDEIENLAKARKIRVLHGRFVEQELALPYQGFREIIQESFRLRETISSSAAASPDFSDLASDLVSLFPMLTEISELRSAISGATTLSRAAGPQAPENRTQIFELLARTLTRIAAGRPLVLVLEDLHGAAMSIEALQYVLRRLGPTPILVMGSYRTTEVDARHPLTKMLAGFRGDRHFSSIALGPFPRAEHRLFLQTIVGGTELDKRLVDRLYEASEGNPYFTKELVRSLLDSGGITRDDTGSWTLSNNEGISSDTLPATIQQAVEKRIERLPEELRELLSAAAVLGRSFDTRDLATIAEAKTSEIDDALDRLIREGLLEEERESRGDRLAFSSGVVREVLYAGLSRRRRRSLHRRCAEQIESRYAGRLPRVYPLLVHHYSQGDVPDKTVDYGLLLARASLDAHSPEESIHALKTALEFLDEEWEGDRAVEGEARLLLARSHGAAGDIEAALKEAEAAIRILEKIPAKGPLVAALLLAAETAWQARRIAEATRWMQRGLETARAASDTDGLRSFYLLAATLATLTGDHQKARSYQDEVQKLSAARKEVESEEAPPPGGRLVVALASTVAAGEPAGISTVEEEEILGNVFETLLATDRAGGLVPGLCERWEARDGGKSFVLTLRSGVRFEDGQALTARDVKRSFERSIRLMTRELPPGFAAIRGAREFKEKQADEVAGLGAPSDLVLEIGLLEPLSIYPALLTHLRTAIVRGEGGVDTADRAVGTGPFRFAPGASRSAGEKIVLERSEKYWKGAPALVDAVEFVPGLPAATIAAGMRRGDLDVARDLLPQDLEDLLRDPLLRKGLIEAPKKNTYFILFNCVSGPAARDPRLRRALARAIRTQDLVWRTLGRFAQPAVCLIPPGMMGHDAGRRHQPQTPEEAAELLRSAGFAGGVTLKASVHPLLQDRYRSLLESLLALWSSLGVTVTVEASTMAQYVESFERSETIDLMIGRWNADYNDPDNFTHNLFHSRVGQLKKYFSSEETDRILEEARSETRPGARENLYRKFDSHLVDTDALAPLFHDIEYRLAGPKVRGMRLLGSPPYVNYASLGKTETAAAAAEPRRAGGGVIQAAMEFSVTHVDPGLTEMLEEGEVCSAVYETLTRQGDGVLIVPWLAAEFRPENGGRQYAFRLREDVMFHDGRRLSARDVRYSFERMLLATDSKVRQLYSMIRGARAIIGGTTRELAGFRMHSATEFTIELDEPVAFFPALLAFSAAGIVPEGSGPVSRDRPEPPVGTGPFRVVKFEAGRRLELERNRSYWRKGYPRAEGLVFHLGLAPTEILSGFRAGRYSLCADLFPSDADQLRRQPEFAAGYQDSPRLVTYYLLMNIHRGPLADLQTRRALIAALDVPAMVRETLGRLAVPAHSFIPPGLLGHEPAPTRRAAGPAAGPMAGPPAGNAPPAPGGIGIKAVFHPVFFGGYSAFAGELTRRLGAKGFEVTCVNRHSPEFMGAVENASVDLGMGRWIADYPDTDTFVDQLHTQRGFLGRFCGIPAIDRLIDRGRLETAPSVRHSIYREIEEIIAKEALLLPLFHDQAYRFGRPELEGLGISLWTPTVRYENLRLRD